MTAAMAGVGCGRARLFEAVGAGSALGAAGGAGTDVGAETAGTGGFGGGTWLAPTAGAEGCASGFTAVA